MDVRMNHHIRHQLTSAAWKGRLFRMVGVTLGFWMSLGAVTNDISWGAFGAVISTPYAVVGLAVALLAAGTTSGAKSEDYIK